MAPRFNIGQTVELEATFPGGSLNTGDKGTIVERGLVNEFGAIEVTVLWQKNSQETIIEEDRLRISERPISAPGVSHDNGRTGYSKRRRLLRDHRRKMRVMDDVINDHGLAEVLEDRMIQETGTSNFWLGADCGKNGMDEDSDEEDPEAALREEVDALRGDAVDKKSFFDAVSGALESRALATDFERTRMKLEDVLASSAWPAVDDSRAKSDWSRTQKRDY